MVLSTNPKIGPAKCRYFACLPNMKRPGWHFRTRKGTSCHLDCCPVLRFYITLTGEVWSLCRVSRIFFSSLLNFLVLRTWCTHPQIENNFVLRCSKFKIFLCPWQRFWRWFFRRTKRKTEDGSGSCYMFSFSRGFKINLNRHEEVNLASSSWGSSEAWSTYENLFSVADPEKISHPWSWLQ